MTRSLLRTLQEVHEEQERRPSPRRYLPPDDLPEDFADLDVDLILFDDYIAGHARRALDGETLEIEDLQPVGHEELRQKIDLFSHQHPEIAGPFAEEFRFLDRMLDLLRAIAEQSGELR